MKASKRKHGSTVKKSYQESYEELKKFVEINQESYKKDLELLYTGMHKLENFLKRLKQNI